MTLTDLTVYTMYVIDVSAVSSGGIGPANTAKARTDAAGTEFCSLTPPGTKKYLFQEKNVITGYFKMVKIDSNIISLFVWNCHSD